MGLKASVDEKGQTHPAQYLLSAEHYS